MKKTILILVIITSVSSYGQKQKNVKYPQTKKGETVDLYFDTKVHDPYRWLEDDKSAETAAWVKAENEVTYDYLSKIPFRKELKDRLQKLWNYEKIGSPSTEGNYSYFFKNNGLQNQSVLYRKDASGKEEIFLDPNTFSKDGTTSLGEMDFSKDGSKMAYSISEGGSDWRKVIIMDAPSKKIIEDTLVDVKFSGLSWQGNEGFYYSSYDKPKGSQLSAKTDQHKLYFHKLGTSQKDDQVIFGADQKRRYVGGGVTDDDNYLIISASTSTYGNELYFKDLTKPNSPIVTIVDNFNSDNGVIENVGSKLYIETDLNAPNKRIVTVDASNPKPENWKDFIPETENVLTPSTCGGFFFANYMKLCCRDWERLEVLAERKQTKPYIIRLPIILRPEQFMPWNHNPANPRFTKNQKWISTAKNLFLNKCFTVLKMEPKSR